MSEMVERLTSIISKMVADDMPSADIAVAVIEAMREPTNVMLQAAGEEWHEAQLAWDTMIDAALK